MSSQIKSGSPLKSRRNTTATATAGIVAAAGTVASELQLVLLREPPLPQLVQLVHGLAHRMLQSGDSLLLVLDQYPVLPYLRSHRPRLGLTCRGRLLPAHPRGTADVRRLRKVLLEAYAR